MIVNQVPGTALYEGRSSGPARSSAVNVDGAVIPGLLSLYLLVKNRLWVRGFLATAGVAAVCHLLASPVGITLPVFGPDGL